MHIQTERVLHKHHKVLILGRLRRNAAAKKKRLIYANRKCSHIDMYIRTESVFHKHHFVVGDLGALEEKGSHERLNHFSERPGAGVFELSGEFCKGTRSDPLLLLQPQFVPIVFALGTLKVGFSMEIETAT